MPRLLVWGMLVIGWCVAVWYVTHKPLPVGVSVAGPMRSVPADAVTFLADRTFVTADGSRHVQQQIFDEVGRMIDGAEQYIVVDMFLFNSFQGQPPEMTRALADEVTAALITKKEGNPDIAITVVSDPLNTVYGGSVSIHFQKLAAAGIPVVVTDLTKLRDSNPAYSIIWRALPRWFGNTARGGWLPHPFAHDGGQVTLRSGLSLLNFKANHRKLIVADTPGVAGQRQLATLITSANPHDGSSAHANIAVKVVGSLGNDAVASEQAVARFSGGTIVSSPIVATESSGPVRVQLLTEGAIVRRLVTLTDATTRDDTIDMAMFYLSERSVIMALKNAAARGVTIRLILDPNKDAFGHTKNGVPNRPVADELVSAPGTPIAIRWCDTHGEQCHSKLTLFALGDMQVLVAGSANLTRRNVGDYNLETNVLVEADDLVPAIVAARDWFEEVWTNRNGRTYTTDYLTYADSSLVKKVLYHIQERTGLSSF